MNYEVTELIRGIGMGKIDEKLGRELINEYIDLNIRINKEVQKMFPLPMTPGTPVDPIV